MCAIFCVDDIKKMYTMLIQPVFRDAAKVNITLSQNIGKISTTGHQPRNIPRHKIEFTRYRHLLRINKYKCFKYMYIYEIIKQGNDIYISYKLT